MNETPDDDKYFSWFIELLQLAYIEMKYQMN